MWLLVLSSKSGTQDSQRQKTVATQGRGWPGAEGLQRSLLAKPGLTLELLNWKDLEFSGKEL